MESRNNMLSLYQAEWCPHSRRVRMRLTELGLTWLALPVEPDPEERAELRRISGDDSIPVLVTDEGKPIGDADEIIAWLDANFEEPPTAAGHRAEAREQGLAV